MMETETKRKNQLDVDKLLKAIADIYEARGYILTFEKRAPSPNDKETEERQVG